MHLLHKLFLCVTISISFELNSLIAQSVLLDDFGNKNEYWYWRSDGNQSTPSVKDGLLELKLINAVDSFYCNTEIYDPTEPYTAGTQVRMRLKCSEIHTGSRGWGFWDGDIDLPSLVFDYDVAWVMQQGSKLNSSDYNWFLFGVDGDTLINRQTFNLQNVLDETEWHTYKIIWEEHKVSFFIDDNYTYETFNHLPDQPMRVDIWIDNRVFNITNPFLFSNNNSEFSWILVDFIEISGLKGSSINRELTEDIKIWDSPNSFPNGEREILFKNYNFDISADNEALIFITGSAENYGSLSEDDDLKVILNDFDYGWDTKHSLDGFTLNGRGKSIVVSSELIRGNNNLQIFTDVTPFLRDVIILHSANGKILFSENYNQSISSEDGLWKTIEFSSQNSDEITILASGTGEEGDGLRFELNEINFGWEYNNSINGTELLGIPNTVALSGELKPGLNYLKIYKKGNPEIYSVAAYGSSNVTNVKIGSGIPNSISLQINPNPFNISTNIRYVTNSTSKNKLQIFNSLGERVNELVNEFQSPGSYTVNWNADHQSSGIYFCILEADNYFVVEKLLLLK